MHNPLLSTKNSQTPNNCREINYQSFAETKLEKICDNIQKKVKLSGKVLITGCALAGLIVLISILIKSHGLMIIGLVSFIFSIGLSVLLYSSTGNVSKIMSLQSGIEGEISFANILKKAAPPYHTIIYDYTTPRGDIDAIVVGKTGVYVFEVKNVKGFLTTENGEWKRYKIGLHGNVYSLKTNNYELQVKRNVAYIKNLLQVNNINTQIDYYVVFTNKDLQIDEKIKNEKMIHIKDFENDFAWNKENLTNEQVEKIIRTLQLASK